MLELLACAGSPEAVTAAVQNGADAVYLSFDELSDCRKADNFSDAGFEAAVRYCRVRGCRVYLALNTPVREDEIQKAGGLALRGQRAGVDAVILRDLGLFSVLRRLLPDMPLFADKHMGFTTPESLRIAASLGFSRVFLPPELPMDEIKRLSNCGVDTVVYGQTSLCAAGCGTCRMSAAGGQGSEDRGLCSEICRESYTFGGRWDTTPLSFKDRSLLDAVGELEEAGVFGVALGNRERRPEYVAAYTAAFRKAIRESQTVSDMDRETMEHFFCPHGVARTELFEPVETAAPEEDRRRADKYFAQLRKTYTEGEERRVGVSFAVAANGMDQPIYLGVQDEDKHTVTMEGPMPDPMGDLELTEEALTQAMYRTAGTPFRSGSVGTSIKDGLRMSAVELDTARRRLLYKLSEERSKAPERKEGNFPSSPSEREFHRVPLMNFSVQTAAQLTPELAALEPACLYVPLELLAEDPERAAPFRDRGCEICAVLPRLVQGELEEHQLRELLKKAADGGVERALAGNLGLAVMAGQEGMKLRGDLDLAVTNSYALHALESAGFLSVCLSPELSLSQIRDIPPCADTELVIYGRLPAMITQTCLIKKSAGRCVCSTPAQMADTRGGVWPVTKAFGCRNTLWSSRKLWLADAVGEWTQLGLWAVRLSFSTESPRECLDVANSYIHATGYRPNGMTRGAYFRGVL